MANKDDYLTEYRKFFEDFAETVNPHDQLPVKLACYKLVNVEVVGGIIDWTTQYLTQKQCPENLIAPLIKIVIDEIRKACMKHPVACGYNTSDEAYEPLKLMQCVMAKTNEVCLRYLDNSMLCSLPSPGPPYNVVSVSALKNLRRKMEDRHVVVHDLNTMFNVQKTSPSSYYAIFDGHAGHDAAVYCSAHLHQFLAESKHFIHNPEQALIDAFCKTDALFIDKCKVEKLSSGTTAVCALLRPKEKILYIAWVGDSQALLVNQGRVLQCVMPHKPSREDEKNRIENQGGMVIYWGTWRVNGQLAVSRAIGDAEYKPYVTATPDVQAIPLSGGEDFLILACDGLWDFLSEDEAAFAVYNMVYTNPDDTESISYHLAQLAKQKGSADNISVIVVFLREPSKVAADAHWANRNRLTMEAGLDNANATNNLFTNSNGAEILQQKEGFLLNLTEGFKQNGAELSPADNYVFDRPTNGKRPAEEFDEDEDMGPETDVDAIDDISSPTSEQQILDNKNLSAFDPFTTEIEEKGSFEMDLNIQKQQSSEFDPPRSPREETPTPPANEVHDAGVEENVADSAEDSEDEWNYYKGDSGGSEKVSSSKADQEVAALTKTVEEEDEEAMSQLNPNAAEFVPIASPTRNVASPACRALLNDQVIAQSPRKATPTEIDINLPNPQDFEKEVKSRPSDLFNISQDSENNLKLSSQEVMENLLNGRNIDEIEFHPASTPVKTSNPDEFHFGPNATPFSTPAKVLDQSEAASTKAEFGDESTASYLDGKTLECENTNPFTTGEDVQDFQPQLNKPTDPMSMSFYQDENDSNPFDLNKVQMLPDDDEFVDKIENDSFANETISDLPEHDPLGRNEPVTDLDKPADTQSEDLFGFTKLPQTPEPINIEQEIDKKEEPICDLPIAKSPILIEASKAPLPVTPEPNSEEQDVSSAPKTPDAVSPIPQENILNVEELSSPIPPKSPLHEFEDNFGVCDVKPSLESDLIVSEQRITPSAFSPEPTEFVDVFSKSPIPIDDRQMPHVDVFSKSPVHDFNLSLSDTKSPTISPEPLISPEVIEELLCQSKSLIPEVSKSPEATLEPTITEKPDDYTEEFFNLDIKTETSKPSVAVVDINFQETDYFPICSKSPVSDVPPLIFDSKEEFQATEYFPICSKSPVSDVPPLILESKVEIQEQTILTELINVKEVIKSPIPLENEPEVVLNVESSKSPEPTLTELTSTVTSACEFSPITNVPKDESIDDVKSPVPPPQETLSAIEVSDLLQTLPELEPENEISLSPEPIESNKDELQSLEMSEQLLVNEIQNILDTSEPVVPTECEAKSPETIEESLDSEKRDLESPMEDITSSIKDDNSLTPEIIEEAKDFSTEKESKRDVPPSAPQLEISNQDYAQELFSAMQEHSETVLEKEMICQVSSTPNTTLSIDTESVNTADVNSFLNRSNVLDVTSPLSPNEQTELLPTEDIVKTDLITPQYPEEAVITPSEETPTADNSQAPAALPEVVSEAEIKEKEELADKTIIAPAVGASIVVVAAAAATAAIVKDKKSSKPLAKVQPTAKKTTKPTTTTTKTTTARSICAKTSTTTKSSVPSPTKPFPPATKTTKQPITTKPPITSRTTLKPPPKPKTEVALTKSIEKKTLTNGDVKALPRSSPTVRKVPTSTTTKSTATARTALTSKLSPTKTDSKSSITKTNSITATKTTTVPKTASSTLPAISKPRPTSLTSKTSGTFSATKTTSTVSATKTTVQTTRTSIAASSPRTATAKPKPPTSLTAKPPTTVTAPKPRLSGPKTPTKGPDTEKQLKDSVNKQLTASRNTAITKTSGTFSTGRTTTTTVKKTEMKSPSTRTSTTTKTTVMTIKPTTKKPVEITRINKKIAPIKTTIKSQENGLTNGVTTIVQETTTILSTEPQLIKDLSPVENKLLVDNAQLSETNVAD